MRTHLRLVIATAYLVSLLATRMAAADDTFAKPSSGIAREHLSRGIRLYNTRDFESAIQEFREGAVVESTPVFDYNLGQSYRQIGKYEEALWHYERFLNHGHPTGQLLAAVKDFMREMREHLANRALNMPPTDAASPAPGPAPAPAAAPDVVPGPAEGPPQRLSPPDRHHGSFNWIGWTLTGAGGIATGAAGYLLLRASSLNDQANDEVFARRRDDLHDEASTRSLAGAIIGVGGVLLTVTGIYMLVTHSERSETQHGTALGVGITGHGVIAFGRF